MGQCYSSVLFGKQRKIHPGGWRVGQPKRLKEKRGQRPNFGSSFYVCVWFFFSPPPSLPDVNWTRQEGCLFHLKFSFQSSHLPLFYFCGLFPTLSFSHCHFELLFPILSTKAMVFPVVMYGCES